MDKDKVVDENMSVEELQEFVDERWRTFYAPFGDRFRIRFQLGGVNCQTAPMTLEQVVEYHRMESPFAAALDEAGTFDSDDINTWPHVEYESIPGKQWRAASERYRKG